MREKRDALNPYQIELNLLSNAKDTGKAGNFQIDEKKKKKEKKRKKNEWRGLVEPNSQL